ncbi:glycosyltransferase [Latilactobacillus sakei]|uniref:glycosyltransferase n=1 Tax=Latilactobacillus sakei TaxID=1599 RepID=UPI0020C7B056|nr:glycosyltransferase [Latilactobacillus sakei]MCP8854244.1 glycosyltransferase [Latilactobacillus sakei]
MHYVIVDFVVRKNSGGILSILQDVNRYAENHPEDSFTFIVGSEDVITKVSNINLILREDLQKNYFKRIFFDFFAGAKFINSLNADVVISLQNTAILGLNTPEMLYVHQPLPFERNYKFSFFKASERKMAFYQHLVGSMIKLNLRKFNHGAITVQTHWMKEELNKYSQQQIFVTRPSISNDEFKHKKIGQSGRDFFFPSTAMIYKNHKNLVEAYNGLPEEVKASHKLILTITKEEYRTLYGNISDDSYIEFTGRIPRTEVIDILSHSFLVFPSKIETLGLPLIEAMMLQRQIIASNISPVVEVTSEYDAVTYFNPDEVSSIRLALFKCLEMPPSKKKFEEKSQSDGWQEFFKNIGEIKDAK